MKEKTPVIIGTDGVIRLYPEDTGKLDRKKKYKISFSIYEITEIRRWGKTTTWKVKKEIT